MNILITIRDYNGFPEAESHIRDYVLRNSQKVINMSVYELASETYSSTATIIRFCRRIGCKGYTDFKLQLASELQVFNSVNMSVLDSTSIQQEDSFDDVIDKITNISIRSIEETRILLDQDILKKVARQILNASVIDFYGMGASNAIAFDAAYKFMRIGKNVSCFSVSDRQYVQAVNADSTHLSVLISYSGETKEILQIAEVLQKNNVPSVSITSNLKNSLLKFTDYHLFVSAKETVFRSGAMASRTSTLYMLDLLYSLCISLEWEQSKKKIDLTRVVSK